MQNKEFVGEREMKEKYKIVLLTAFVLVFLVLYTWQTRTHPPAQEEMGEINSVPWTISDEDYYTGGELHEPIQYDNIVFLDNGSYLYEQGLDQYGINSFETYLLRYLNYYLGAAEYHAVVFDYKGDVNFPSFTAIVEDYKIKCIYDISSKRYAFHCDEIRCKK